MEDFILDLCNPPNDWKDCFLSFGKSKLEHIQDTLKKESKTFNDDRTISILPNRDDVLNAFKYSTFKDTKILIMGQDPYPNKKKSKITGEKEAEAMGLSFSVNKGMPIPGSLRNIYKDLDNDDEVEFTKPDHGDLSKWAKQGVLMLNGALTVVQLNKLSHMPLWKDFTNHVIKYISDNKEGVIFMLWGGYAKDKKQFIDTKKHYILEAIHPSPLNGEKFVGTKHFSQANQLLRKMNLTTIDWDVDGEIKVEDVKKEKVVKVKTELAKCRKYLRALKESNYKTKNSKERKMVDEMIEILGGMK